MAPSAQVMAFWENSGPVVIVLGTMCEVPSE